jgi:hypothetical protein
MIKKYLINYKIIIPPLNSNFHSYKKYVKTDSTKYQTERVKNDLLNLQIHQKNIKSKNSNYSNFISNSVITIKKD